jgi:hypothetical protein
MRIHKTVAAVIALFLFTSSSVSLQIASCAAEDGSAPAGKRVVMQQQGAENDEFSLIDIDKNGVVSRDEWKGSKDEFDKRDIDKSNTLSRYEFYNALWPTKL